MILPDTRAERKLWKMGFKRLVGVDEVGRGALAGPVVAAAVWWKKPREPFRPPLKVRDSKHLSPRARFLIYQWLRANPNFTFRTASSSARLIDEINIRQANFKAMVRAVKKLPTRPQILLIDGLDQIPIRVRQYTYRKGDERRLLISLASIVAKVTRDSLMTKMARRWPKYKFEVNKGYGTRKHRLAIKKFGASPIHRKTFL